MVEPAGSATPVVEAATEAEIIIIEKRGWLQWMLPNVVFELENKGSVARDHLANERTYLAWIRTSLSLASIGIAITQLFRLGSAVVSGPSLQLSTSLPFIKRSGAPGQLILSSLSSPPTLTLEKLYSLIQSQQAQINALTASCQSIQNPAYDPEKYRYLGKPVGGTFIMLALLFLYLGTHRYFRVQFALMESPSVFPPSRRSVTAATFSIVSLIVATFAVILMTR